MRVSLASSLNIQRNTDAPQKTLARGDKNAKILAVAAQKGGVGKTTTSLTLASAFARFHGKRVLLIDLDPQGHVNTSLREQVDVGGGALSDLLTEPTHLEVEDICTSTTIENLFVTPPDPSLLMAEDRMASRIGKEMVLRNALALTRTHYDVIVMDCPPNIGALTVNALVAADHVIVPANAAALAVAGISGVWRAIDEVQLSLNPSLRVLGVLLTRMDGRNTSSNQAIRELVQDTWGDVTLPVHIGVNEALSQAQLAGRDIFDFAPSSRGAKQYRALATHLVEHLF